VGPPAGPCRDTDTDKDKDTNDMKYYTLKEAGVTLKLTEEQVFERVTGKHGPILWPAAFFESVEVSRYSRDPEEISKLECFEKTLTGIFELIDITTWDADGRAVVNSLSTNELDEHERLIPWVVKQSIHRDDLRVSSASIEHYMDLKKILVPDHIRQEAANQKTPEDEQDECSPAFDVNEYMASYRNAIDCTWLNCSNCPKHNCRNQLAHDLFTYYGDHTEHKLNLWKIGVSLGLPEPTWAQDQDSEKQKKRQKKELGAIKTTVRRWKTAHLKIVTPSHPSDTP